MFRLLVQLCAELGLCGKGRVCVDGTTIKAVNGMDEQDKIDQGRLNQPFALDIDPVHLPNLEGLKKHIAFHEQCIRDMEEKQETQLTFTDPDAQMMPSKRGGLKACYSIQTATEPESHMITGFLVTDHSNDMGTIYDTAVEARENMGVQAICVTADKGYESREDITACLHAGVLPKCYANTNLRVELQQQTVESCFIRHTDGSVTCPMGRLLVFQGNKKNGAAYGSKEACRCCPNRCTDGKTFKTVKFGPNAHYVPVRMYGSPRYPLQQIPDVEQPEHYHAYGRVQRAPARMMLFIRRDKEKQKERMQVSEHPLGRLSITPARGISCAEERKR